MATSLALNAYMLHRRGEVQGLAARIRRRLAAAACSTTTASSPPTSASTARSARRAGGKWYGGVYGWGFTRRRCRRPASSAHRNTHHLGLTGFGNAYLLTGDDRYLDPWRKMIDKINAQARRTDGAMTYPHMYGDQGWYDFTPAEVQARCARKSGTGR